MSEKSTALLKELQAGITDLCASGKWTEYLDFVSKFPRYSARNTMLIYMQRPDATYVGSMSHWNGLNGHVYKGSHSIRILAPHTYKVKNETTGEEEERLGFHVANVFDISDVDVDMPDNMCHELSDDKLDYDRIANRLAEIADCPISYENMKDNARGYYSPEEDRIAIKIGMPAEQTVKTMIHEIAHSILHRKGADEENADRDIMEEEAESVAYIVSRRLGMDNVGDYSFSYVAGWSGMKPEKLMDLADSIVKTADDIWNRISEEVTA